MMISLDIIEEKEIYYFIFFFFFFTIFIYTTMRISLIISFDSKSGNGDTSAYRATKKRILAMFTAHKIHG